jgi:hypothetical protein
MKTPHYHAYLLRLWQTGSSENPLWRASLEDPHTHILQGFNDLDALCAHLYVLTQTQRKPGAKNPVQKTLFDQKEKLS